MANPMITRRRVLHVIQEATAGTAESIGAAPYTTLAIENPSFTRSVPFEAREGLGGFGSIRGTPGQQAGTISFTTPLFGTASTTWASVLLPACGLSLLTGGYRPTSLPPGAVGATSKTLSMYYSEDGRRHVIRGAMGNLTIRGSAGQRAVAEWSFTGRLDTPTDVALPTYSQPTALPIRVAAAALTIASFAPKVADFSLTLGNDVQLREDISSAAGILHAYVANRAIAGTLNQEAELVATYAPMADYLTATVRALSLTLGASGNQVAISVPDMQLTDVQSADRNGKLHDILSWVALRDDLSGDGDDEITIALS